MSDSQINDDIKEIKTTVNNYLPTADHLDRNFQKVLIVLQDIKREVLDLKKKVNEIDYNIRYGK